MPTPGAAALARLRRFIQLDMVIFGRGTFEEFVSEIFREIDEELRRENLLKLWSRYGKHIIIAAVAAVLIAGGMVYWREHQAAERRAQSARYTSALALLRDGKDADAKGVFAAISGEGSGYSVLAAFNEAELLAKTDPKAGIAAYDRIAGSAGFDREFRDLALLLSVMHGLPEGDANQAIQRLQPLTASGNPWRASALELTAAAKLKAGDRPGALDLYKKLADDQAAPQRVRARAAEMAAALAS